MNGITMMARIRPAVKMPMPIGAPWNRKPISGHSPRFSMIHGCTWSPNSGANTNRPHMP
ncbi:hypothetical protein D3C84_938740 [compost metagenome]